MTNRRLLIFLFLLTATTFTYKAGAATAGSSLCGPGEVVIFSCPLKGSNKIVSLCSSPKLTKTEGYLQYRFGLPTKVELEYPTERRESQKSFRYSHYFRAQVDLTEISFTSGNFNYTVFDSYNGEERPAVSDQGVTVSATAGKKEVTHSCRGRAQAKLGVLTEVLENTSEP